MEKENLYRKQSMDRIQSPEQLNDYLHITKPSVWLVLAAVLLLLIGFFIWSSFNYIDSVAYGNAKVEQGRMTIRFEDEERAEQITPGMQVEVGDTVSQIRSLGKDELGTFAVADAVLTDGEYEAVVRYEHIQILKLLFR